MAAIRITGFKFAGLSCAINKSSKRRDLALIASDRLVVVAAARFATNRVKAAPVMMEMHHSLSALLDLPLCYRVRLRG